MTGFAQKYHGEGFWVLAFPCNQFGKQEPGSEADIKKFVSTNYGIPKGMQLFSKIDVNGENTHPVYKHLKAKFPGDVSWNFMGHFLIGRDGSVLQRFGRMTSYSSVQTAIEEALKK
uniref:Glutathione peroxidase n=1 Tax=Lotharella globosa TaxID=91324 RepID=A0A6V3Q5A6_9EUKA|mmetsp:Transcript_19348/g.39177  ORF Transcript_19348/g.39177 Transcript_19348/m.39177 type:complete len:116 (+) Transcript_19348:306-653(+)|eukprot:CAMPEP_0167776980 /NCGR_PEP_ID=MMETSP0111_2-20121227/3432_1 /TAXON_ID=91324 /ORGANISM="Lotharella globosa, Strain CCCM811" /LENGTH=115 /DNA_ID=CAMNT_0007667099 /DNA_START=410 /DNA_END=757 /DNA_ORIENTATION=+